MVMYGAETDELDRIAAELVRVADDLDAGANGLTSAVSTVAWFGEAAIGYLADWTSLKIPRLNLTTHFLRDAAVELRQQAREQRLASDRWGSTYVKDAGWGTREAIATGLDDELVDVRHKSPEAQRAWWDSLTDSEREALIRNRSEAIFVLDGLPQADIDAARTYWENEIAPAMVVLSETELDVSLKVTPEFVDLIGKGSVKITEYADGSIDLEIDGSAGVGLSADDAAISLTGKGTTRLHFESQDEFDEFTHDLIEAETSNKFVRDYRRGQLLAEHAASIEQVGVGVAGSSKFGDSGGSVSVAGGFNIPDRTITGTMSGSASSTGVGDVQVSASVTTGLDGAPKSVTVTTSGSVAAVSKSIEGVVKETPIALGGSAAGTGYASFELDLTDPEVRRFVPSIVSAAGRGDPVEILKQVGYLGDRIEVHASVGTEFEGHVGFDGKVVGVDVSGTHNQTGTVWVRPPNGDFIKVYSVGESASGSAPQLFAPNDDRTGE